VYAIAQKLVFAVERLVYPVSAGFFGHFSGLAAQNDADALRRSFLVGIRAALFVAAPLAIALGLLAGPIVDAWVGPAYHHAAPVLELLLAYTVVVAFSKPAQLILQGTEHAARAAVVFCGEAVANIVLSVVLGLHWGIVGVAAASLIAGVVFRLGVLVPSACRVAGQTPFSLVVVPTVHLLPAAAAVATALALDHGGLAHGPWVVLATAAVLGVYVVGLSVTGVSGVERRRVLASLRALRHG
jgi:O-antigen/teichoic acid export membrane protein